MKIIVYGLGYVGTVTAACLLKQGHHVAGIDVNPAKNEAFAAGRSPVGETGIDELLCAARTNGLILDTASAADHVRDADAILVCVGTPLGPDATPDLSDVLAVTAECGAALKRRPSHAPPVTVAYRSTMLPGSMEETVVPVLTRHAGAPGERYEVAYNPEFLREGTAIDDFFAPPRIVIGERVPGSAQRLSQMYSGIEAPVFEVPLVVAEMLKYADNSFHALKVAFTNELARLAHALAIPAQSVAEVFLADTKLNVSSAYLRPGGAFGGSCLPKDVRALTTYLKENEIRAPLIESILGSNDIHKEYLAEYAASHVPPGGHVLLLGLSFKPGTDDLRGSPLVDLAERLLGKGFRLTIHDPDVRPKRLTRMNLDLARTRLHRLFALLTDDLEEAWDTADMIVAGKPMPHLADRLARDARSVELDRLNGRVR